MTAVYLACILLTICNSVFDAQPSVSTDDGTNILYTLQYVDQIGVLRYMTA